MAVSTSANYNKIISLPGGKKFHSGAHVDFADGRSIEIDDRNIMQGYPSIQDKVSEESVFELGGAYSALLTLKLNNFENEFKDYNFKDAVVKPWIGLTTAVHWRDGEIVEKIPKGVFNITESPETNSIISVTAYDNLVKMDVKYSDKSALAYPATLAQIAADACSVCGINLATAAFQNSDYVVAKRPDSNTITCREVLQYAAQLAGCFAKCNKDGDVEIRWYETPEYVFDIGKNAKTVSVAQNDTTITGVQIQDNDDSKTVYTVGTDDYVVRIQDNPLAQDGLQSLVNAIGTRLVGMRFRSYSVSAPMNPAIETGDIVCLTDSQGIQHQTIVSGLQIDFGDYEQFSGDAESTDENQSERFDKADKAQESADDAQQSADQANDGVAKANIKIGDLEITIQGKVSFSDLENAGSTTINGSNITTGKIQSEDGSYWVDLTTGEVHMEKGTFGGTVEWLDSSGNEGGKIFWTSNGGLRIETTSSDITIDGAAVAVPGTFGAKTVNVGYGGLSVSADGPVSLGSVSMSGSLDVDGNISANGNTGKTESVPVTMGDGSKQSLVFKKGLYVARD